MARNSSASVTRKQRRQARSQANEDRRTETNRRGNQRRGFEQKFSDEAPTPATKALREPLVPLTEKQADYDDAIEESRITFGIGPAGTGKTYYATRKAAAALEAGEIKKIYLTRPAVEAGESLGFLPGELDEKYEPYLRPFKDALIDHFGSTHMEYLIKKKIIEPVPLGFLRGATIKNAWMLADEMQNATKGQMKMLLTRMGKDSKFVINGDPKQLDIPHSTSGLEDAVRRLNGRDNIACIQFERSDVVRDDIVAQILDAYDD